MERLQKSQLPKIVLLALFLTLLILTPFISTSMRSSYLYFLLNLLIIVLGVEAGFISKPHEDQKKPVMANPSETVANCSTATGSDTMLITMQPTPKPVVLEMKQERVQSLKRCKSRPSLFFIGEWEDNDEEKEVKNNEEVVVVKNKMLEEDGEMSKQELFMNAEIFIGNFYKQLKMQREKSRQKLNGLYHKAF